MARSKEFEESAVLEKAMRLFWEQGYEKTSMTDLVEHMGIHRRSLYDTFGDKHTLFLKAMDRYGDKFGDKYTSVVKHSKNATEALQFIVDTMIRLETEEGVPPGCLMVNSAVELATRDADVDSKANKLFSMAEQQLKEIIAWGQRDGEFTTDYDAEELAEYMHNALVGIRVLARTSAAKEKLHRVANLSMKFLQK
ncbi:TetR/AcrR family transcriptional regulator [Paenibacillus sp. NPDC058071]|uniref:TetR/AcrR family transcriptional regulator n=1 Tax=Paenibacillus sp. NPDC058071 TaxID=3346326 RepID=UPI0036DC990C